MIKYGLLFGRFGDSRLGDRILPHVAVVGPWVHHGANFLCLQHGLEIVGNMEGRLGLALDLVDRHAIGNLDQGQAVSKVDIEHTLSEAR